MKRPIDCAKSANARANSRGLPSRSLSGVPGVFQWLEDVENRNREWAGRWLLAFGSLAILAIVAMRLAG